MTFLNFALAFGAAACVIPLVIHLLNRRRFEVVQWGASHLLRPVLNTNRKRIKIEQLILLLTRMAILALLALCMAAPVLTQWRALSGDAKSSLILLLDNSYSMDAGNHAATNLDIGKKDAGKLIEHGRRGSDVSVVLMAGGKVTGSKSPTTNRKKAAQEISELPAGFGAADVAQSFESAAKAAPRMQHAKRDLVIVSDFQSNDWSGDSASALGKATELIDAIPIKPTVTLMQVGSEVSDNVAITSLDINPAVVASGQRVSIRVNVRNHGDVPYPGIQFQLRVNDKDIAARQLDLGPAEDGQLLFHHEFSEPGSHVVQVTADADSLLADNSMLAVVPVWDRLPVLLVDGAPSSDPLKSETAFLKLALSPFLAAAGAASGEDSLPRADLLHATVTSPGAISAETLQDNRVLVLANVARFTDQQLEAIGVFVNQGNSLLIFLGDQIDLDWYQNKMPAELLAAVPEELSTKQLDAQTRRPAFGSGLIHPVSFTPATAKPERANGEKISAEQYDHPALNLFNDKRHGNLGEGTINTWYRLQVGGEANVLARLGSGDPLIVEKALGDGRVMTVATSCDDAWNNLPARPFYLPLMQRLVTYLATAVEPPRNLSTGQTIVAHLPPGVGTATITTPDGQQTEFPEAKKSDRRMIEYSATAQPGLYTVRAASLPELHYSVTAPREESELQLLGEDELQSLAESLGGSVVHSADEFIQHDSDRRYGREIWRHLYWLMLACVVGEILLEQAFSGVLKRG